MKTSNLVRTLFSVLIISCFTISAQAKTISTILPVDTGKMSKMSKMDKKKVDKMKKTDDKMEKKKMDKMDKMKKDPETKM